MGKLRPKEVQQPTISQSVRGGKVGTICPWPSHHPGPPPPIWPVHASQKPPARILATGCAAICGGNSQEEQSDARKEPGYRLSGRAVQLRPVVSAAWLQDRHGQRQGRQPARRAGGFTLRPGEAAAQRGHLSIHLSVHHRHRQPTGTRSPTALLRV